MYTAFLGVLLGALTLPAVSSLFATWFEPEVAGDGQFVFVIVAAVPIGAVLGLVTALAVSQGRRGEQRAAHQTAISGAVAGFILAALTGLPVAILYSLGLAFWGITTWPRR